MRERERARGRETVRMCVLVDEWRWWGGGAGREGNRPKSRNDNGQKIESHGVRRDWPFIFVVSPLVAPSTRARTIKGPFCDFTAPDCLGLGLGRRYSHIVWGKAKTRLFHGDRRRGGGGGGG